jgi:hypothetical protein
MRTGGFELGSSTLTSSTLKWLHRIQCGFKPYVYGFKPGNHVKKLYIHTIKLVSFQTMNMVCAEL